MTDGGICGPGEDVRTANVRSRCHRHCVDTGYSHVTSCDEYYYDRSVIVRLALSRHTVDDTRAIVSPSVIARIGSYPVNSGNHGNYGSCRRCYA